MSLKQQDPVRGVRDNTLRAGAAAAAIVIATALPMVTGMTAAASAADPADCNLKTSGGDRDGCAGKLPEIWGPTITVKPDPPAEKTEEDWAPWPAEKQDPTLNGDEKTPGVSEKGGGGSGGETEENRRIKAIQKCNADKAAAKARIDKQIEETEAILQRIEGSGDLLPGPFISHGQTSDGGWLSVDIGKKKREEAKKKYEANQRALDLLKSIRAGLDAQPPCGTDLI